MSDFKSLDLKRGDILLIRVDPDIPQATFDQLRMIFKKIYDKDLKPRGIRCYFLQNDIALEKISFAEQPESVQEEILGADSFRIIAVGEDWVKDENS